MIHEIRPDGGVLHSFGVYYRTSSYGIQTAMIESGRIACLDDEQAIIAAATPLPEVHSYSPDGRLKWIVTLTDWQHPPIVATARGYRILWGEAQRLDVIVGITVVPSVGVVVQLESRDVSDVRAGTDRPTLRTVLIDPTGGAGIVARRQWPRLLTANASYLLTYADDPHPQVTIWRRVPP